MEKPLFKYYNRLRNSMIIIYWVFIWLCAFGVMIKFTPNFLYLLIISLISLIILWPSNLLLTYIYHDAIVFKEIGFRPGMFNEFGIAFENIYNIESRKIMFNLYWIELTKSNGKSVRRLMSLSKKKSLEFLRIMSDKTKNDLKCQ